ncbi:uncharacterized protein METZ01_LOCUS62091 [marine metagenome]|uniref:Aspartyl/asparaginy/proline hydroxylase domain-containing protein n=1 Tax=marine metagenome TaxID=408172 RepID=A0A381T3Q5_9ZZZZ
MKNKISVAIIDKQEREFHSKHKFNYWLKGMTIGNWAHTIGIPSLRQNSISSWINEKQKEGNSFRNDFKYGAHNCMPFIESGTFSNIIQHELYSDNDWLILMSAGNIITNQIKFQIWMEQLPLANHTKIAAYCHILHKEEDKIYLEWHPQFAVLNLVAMRKYRTKILETIKKNGREIIYYEKSFKDFHDGYTPYYLVPNNDRKREVNVISGSMWMAIMLQENYIIHNFDETMRSAKKYFYLDQEKNIEIANLFHKKWMYDEEIAKEKYNKQKQSFHDFYQFSHMFNDYGLITVNNNHDFSDFKRIPHPPIDTIALPCSGLNFIEISQILKFKDNCTIVHYDISWLAVEYRKKLLLEWDGKDYTTWAKITSNMLKNKWNVEFKNKYPHEQIHQPMNIVETWKHKLNDIDENEWNKIKNYNHIFLNIDVLMEPMPLITALKNSTKGNIFIYYDNILDYASTIMRHGSGWSTSVLKKMIPLLSSFNWWRIESSLISFSSNHAKNISDANLKIAPNDIVIEMFQYNLFIKTKKDLSLTNILSNTDRSSVNWPKIIDNVDWSNDRIRNILKPDEIKNNPNIKYNDFFKTNYIPWVYSYINVDLDQAKKECDDIYSRGLFTNHRPDAGNGWLAFTMHGNSYNNTQASDDESQYTWTDEALKFTPYLVDLIKNTFSKLSGHTSFGRVRITAIEPGGMIFPHRDGIGNTWSSNSKPGPTNIAITHPKECYFLMWDKSNLTRKSSWGILPFEPKKAIKIDINNCHTVINCSNEIRYHIIVNHNSPLLEYKDKNEQYLNKCLKNTIEWCKKGDNRLSKYYDEDSANRPKLN